MKKTASLLLLTLLCFLCACTPQSALEQEYHFFDYGTTVLPDFSYSDVVDGVILDHNGNVVTDIEHLS